MISVMVNGTVSSNSFLTSIVIDRTVFDASASMCQQRNVSLAPANRRTDPGISSVMSDLSVSQAVGSFASTPILDLMSPVKRPISKRKTYKKKGNVKTPTVDDTSKEVTTFNFDSPKPKYFTKKNGKKKKGRLDTDNDPLA